MPCLQAVIDAAAVGSSSDECAAQRCASWTSAGTVLEACLVWLLAASPAGAFCRFDACTSFLILTLLQGAPLRSFYASRAMLRYAMVGPIVRAPGERAVTWPSKVPHAELVSGSCWRIYHDIHMTWS